MRRALDELLRETTLLTLAAVIAIGWSAVELAQAISSVIVGFIEESPEPYEGIHLFTSTLAVHVGDHILVLGPVLDRLLAFVLILGTVLLIVRRRRPA